MGRCDILCLEWGTKNRDSNILMPVLVYLKEEKGYKIKLDSLAYAVLKLVIYRPKMLLVANPGGAPELSRVVKHAYLLGIKTVSLISEGDVVDDPIRAQDSFWGWNFEKGCYLDLFLLWSERSRRVYEKYIPKSKKFNIKVTGATGFDKYKLLKSTYMTRELFCAKYNKRYSKIIGMTSWGFSECFAGLKFDDEERQFYIKSCLKLREILYEIICSLDDVLFVLRPHPGEVSEENEFVGLQELKNVILISAKDESIVDNINVCDLWMAYESTTCMEAWLLDKPTILINPYPIEYARSVIHKGSPIMRDANSVVSCIEEFYQTGKIESFECLESERAKIIQDVIGYSDGKNYMRVGKEIVTVMNNEIKRHRKITVAFLYELVKDAVKWVWQHSFFRRLKDFEKGSSYDFVLSQKDCEDEERVYYNAIYGKNSVGGVKRV